MALVGWPQRIILDRKRKAPRAAGGVLSATSAQAFHPVAENQSSICKPLPIYKSLVGQPELSKQLDSSDSRWCCWGPRGSNICCSALNSAQCGLQIVANHIVAGKEVTGGALHASLDHMQESGPGGAGFATEAPTETLVVTVFHVLSCMDRIRPAKTQCWRRSIELLRLATARRAAIKSAGLAEGRPHVSPASLQDRPCHAVPSRDAGVWPQAVPVYGPGDTPGSPGVGLLATASGPVALVGPTVHCARGALLQARLNALNLRVPDLDPALTL
jgi:hypothetical protein